MRFLISVCAFLNRSSCWPARHVKQQWLYLGEYIYTIRCFTLVIFSELNDVFW